MNIKDIVVEVATLLANGEDGKQKARAVLMAHAAEDRPHLAKEVWQLFKEAEELAHEAYKQAIGNHIEEM